MAAIDGCLLAGVAGRELSEDLARWVDEGLAGVVLFARNFEDPDGCRHLIDALRARREDLVIAIDEEGGDVTRLHAATGSPWPGNLALGAVGEPATTRLIAASIGRELFEAGVTLDFAPVADLVGPETDSVIGTRSFGGDPCQVAAHTAAFVRGLQGTGVAACAKHFPGHGAARADSHRGLPTVALSSESLRRDHLLPFAAAVAAGVAAVMTAHVRYVSLDPDAPATLSKPVLSLLREELGFEGVVVSDALEMVAISRSRGMVAGGLAALDAGVDLLCLGSEVAGQREARDAMLTALRHQALAERLAEKADRVHRLAVLSPPAGGAAGREEGDREAAPTLALEVARRALVVDVCSELPASKPLVLLDARPRGASGIGRTPARLLTALSAAGLPVRVSDASPGEMSDLGPKELPLLVVQDAHLDPAQQARLRALLAAHPEALVVGVGTDHDAGLAPGRYLGTRGGAPPNLAALAEVLAVGLSGG